MMGQGGQNKTNSEGTVRALRGWGVNRFLSFNRQHLSRKLIQLCGVAAGELPRGRGV